ncbi:MAG TPA: ATP-binding protein [Nitrospirota bacterium]|nr:ATP-binding protein [Nitrospirota bacterium]
MEIYNGSATPLLTILREGIEELSGMGTGAEVLRHALKLTLSLSGGYAGYVVRKTEEDVWEIDGVKTLYIPKTLLEELSQKSGLYKIGDELYRFLLEELQVKIQRVMPIQGSGVLAGLLLVVDQNDGQDEGEVCLLLLAQYLSILLANIQIREEMKEMRVHYEDILVQKETAEKLASLGTIAAGLAHEIKNPLVSIKTLAQLLPERFDDPEFRNHFANIAINEVDRIGSIVSDLLDFAKSSEPKIESFDMARVIGDTLLMLFPQLTPKGIIVKKRFAEGLPLIRGDHSQLKQVLLNLLINSMEAMPHGGKITVDVFKDEDVIHGNRLIVRVMDTGTGVREEDKIHLFEPFFTTKGGGTGLGLSICRKITEKHNGEITIESVHNQGTTVTLTLPL